MVSALQALCTGISPKFRGPFFVLNIYISANVHGLRGERHGGSPRRPCWRRERLAPRRRLDFDRVSRFAVHRGVEPSELFLRMDPQADDGVQELQQDERETARPDPRYRDRDELPEELGRVAVE